MRKRLNFFSYNSAGSANSIGAISENETIPEIIFVIKKYRLTM